MHWCDDIFTVLIVSQVVLANGDIVKTASRARKSAAGFVIFSSLYILINFTSSFFSLNDLLRCQAKGIIYVNFVGQKNMVNSTQNIRKYLSHLSTSSIRLEYDVWQLTSLAIPSLLNSSSIWSSQFWVLLHPQFLPSHHPLSFAGWSAEHKINVFFLWSTQRKSLGL